MSSYYFDLINQRTSRRGYRSGALPVEVLDEVRRILGTTRNGIFGTTPAYHFLDSKDITGERIKLGTYGFIQGARYFIAGQGEPVRNTFLDYGYTFEKIILDLTALGLGTCWLGGTFDRGEFARAIGLKPGWSIPAVTPVGYATATRGIGDQVVRLSAGSRSRLPWKDLFFDLETNLPVSPLNKDPMRELFEAVRLAPSASNKQPWRIYRERDQYHFCLSRTPGYSGKHLPVDLQMLDMGIALCHWDLVARERGMTAEWTCQKPDRVPSGPDYIITAIILKT